MLLIGVTATYCAAAQSPADYEQVQKLIEQLSADDFDTREAASRGLLEIGDAAWPQLERALNDKDTERTTRIRALEPQMAAFGPDESDFIATCLAKLRGSDQFRRSEAVEELLLRGIKGKRLLAKNFCAADARLSLTLELDRNLATVGQLLKSRARVTNSGAGAFWSNGTRIELDWVRHEPFGMPRPVVVSRDEPSAPRVAVSGGYRNPIRDWTFVGSAGVVDSQTWSNVLTTPGVYTVQAKYSAPAKLVIAPRIPETSQSVVFNMNEKLPEQFYEQHKNQSVCVWPDFTAQPNPHIEMTAEAAPLGTVGTYHVVQATLRSRHAGRLKIFERNLTSFAWFAVMDDQGRVVNQGNWNMAIEQAGDGVPFDQQPPILVSDATPARYDLRIQLPQRPGKYSIVLGYEVDPPNYDCPLDDDSAARDPRRFMTTPESEKFDRGQLHARVQNIVVTPRTVRVKPVAETFLYKK